ncbi:Zinc finger C2H2-type, partial [Trinorchestia longiramus]
QVSQSQSKQQKVSLREKVSCVSSLAQQLHEVSSQKVAMPCPYCSYSTSSESNLKKHVASHKESNMELYSCLLCPFTTIYKYQLKTHTDRHSLEFGKHLCRFCNFSTADPEDLDHHLKSHETCEVLVCEYCGYKSTHKASFNKHIRKHGRPCPVCSYITFDKADMERHCESHLVVGEASHASHASHFSGNIEFVCCGEDKKILSHKDGVSERKETSALVHSTPLHPKKQSINLSLCSKKFTIAKTCTAKNRYLCMLCNYSCRYKFSLKQHMVTHTGVGKLPCPFCKHESGNRSNLRKHVTAKHPGQTLANLSKH